MQCENLSNIPQKLSQILCAEYALFLQAWLQLVKWNGYGLGDNGGMEWNDVI